VGVTCTPTPQAIHHVILTNLQGRGGGGQRRRREGVGAKRAVQGKGVANCSVC
jgi:hypothetical protein